MIAIKIAATSWFLTALLTFLIHRYERVARVTMRTSRFMGGVLVVVSAVASVSTLVSIWGSL
jgi:hypothetical protein